MKPLYLLVLNLLWAVFCVRGSQNAQLLTKCNESNIFEIVPPEYKKSVAPSTGDNGVSIYVNLQIADIYGLDEESMDFYVHMYFNDMWKDKRLSTECLQSTRPVILPHEIAEKLWVPDFIFENSKWGEMFKISVPNTNIKVLHDGTIYRCIRYVLRISCPMDLHFYPMDTQICSIHIALFAHPDDEARLHWTNEDGSPRKDTDAVSLLATIKLPQFHLSAINTTKHTINWDTGSYTTLLARFTLSRHITSYVINTYIPSILVVVMSWLSFWLDVGAVPARVTLGVTSLLTLATQVVQSRSSLPPVAYVNALDVWLFFCINMVFATLVEYGISYYIAYFSTFEGNFFFFLPRTGSLRKQNLADNSKKSTKPQCWISSQDTKKPMMSPSEAETKLSERTNKKQDTTGFIDKISRLIFPFLFLVFNTLYWPYYLTFSTPGVE